MKAADRSQNFLIDGCNMGVQGITENIHKYKEASKESKSLAQKLVKLEEDMMKDMRRSSFKSGTG